MKYLYSATFAAGRRITTALARPQDLLSEAKQNERMHTHMHFSTQPSDGCTYRQMCESQAIAWILLLSPAAPESVWSQLHSENVFRDSYNLSFIPEI